MLHDALRVIAGTREMGTLENESKADSLSMAISGISPAGCANYAVGSKPFYALNWCGVPFCLRAPEKGLSGWAGRQVWLGKRRFGGVSWKGLPLSSIGDVRLYAPAKALDEAVPGKVW